MCRAMWIVLFVAICQVAFGLPQGGFQNPSFGSDGKPSSLPKPIGGQTDNHEIKSDNNSSSIKSTVGAHPPISHDGPSSSSFPRTKRQADNDEEIKSVNATSPIKPLVVAHPASSSFPRTKRQANNDEEIKPVNTTSPIKPLVVAHPASSSFPRTKRQADHDEEIKPVNTTSPIKPLVIGSSSGSGSHASASEVVSTAVKPDSPAHASDSNSDSPKKTQVAAPQKPVEKPDDDDDSNDRNRRGVDDFPSKPTNQTGAATPTDIKPLKNRQDGTEAPRDDEATTRKSFFPSRN